MEWNEIVSNRIELNGHHFNGLPTTHSPSNDVSTGLGHQQSLSRTHSQRAQRSLCRASNKFQTHTIFIFYVVKCVIIANLLYLAIVIAVFDDL